MDKFLDLVLNVADLLKRGCQAVFERVTSINSSIWFKCMIATGILTLATFTYSFVILPVWTYALVPAWTWLSTPRPKTEQTATAPPANATNTSITRNTDAPRYSFDNNPQPKPVDCDAIIKKIKRGKYVELPEECSSVYAISREQDAAREQARQEAQNRRDNERQQEAERKRLAQEQGRQSEQEWKNEMARQQEEKRRLNELNYQRNREIEEQNKRERAEKASREEARREQARQEAQRIEEEKRRQRNEAIIKAGRDIKDIFRKKP